MIKKLLILLLIFITLSGCNLAIGYFDSTIPEDNIPEHTMVPTPVVTVEPTLVPTSEATAEPTPEPTAERTVEPTPEITVEPTPVCTLEPPIENLVRNGDFETGDKTGWTGSFVVAPSSANAGSYGARMNSSSTLSQIITGLTPETDYVLSYFTKFESIPGTGSLVIQDFCAVTIEEQFSNENAYWIYNTIPFTTSHNVTSVTITFYCAMVNVNIDDVVLHIVD